MIISKLKTNRKNHTRIGGITRAEIPRTLPTKKSVSLYSAMIYLLKSIIGG